MFGFTSENARTFISFRVNTRTGRGLTSEAVNENLFNDGQLLYADRALFAVAFLGHVLAEIPGEHVPKVLKMTLLELFAAHYGPALATILEECADELVDRIITGNEAVKRAPAASHPKVVPFRPRVVH